MQFFILALNGLKIFLKKHCYFYKPVVDTCNICTFELLNRFKNDWTHFWSRKFTIFEGFAETEMRSSAYTHSFLNYILVSVFMKFWIRYVQHKKVWFVEPSGRASELYTTYFKNNFTSLFDILMFHIWSPIPSNMYWKMTECLTFL